MRKIVSFVLMIAATHLFSFSPEAQQKQKAELIIENGHSASVHSVAFSPDGKILASGSNDNTVRLWSVEARRELKTLKEHTGAVHSVAFSPDGKILASGSADKTIRLWDLETGYELKALKGFSDFVWSVSFSPEGKMLAGCSDKEIIIWDVETGEILKTLSGEDEFITILFSPNGKTLVSGGYDGTIKLWDLKTGQESLTLRGHEDSVRAVAFSPDGKTLASGSDDQTIRLWNAETGRELKILKGHSDWITSIAFSFDGRTLASGNRDTTIRIWNAETGQEVNAFAVNSGIIRAVAFSPDGKTLAAGSDDMAIRLLDLNSGKELKPLSAHSDYIVAIAFSKDGKFLAVASNDTVKLWNMESGTDLKTLKGHTGYVSAVAFSPDGKRLASGSKDETIKLWNTKTALELKSLEGNGGLVYSVAFSPDGRLLASGHNDNTVRIWEIETGKELKSMKSESWVTSLTFSIDGRLLASQTWIGIKKLWEVDTGREVVYEKLPDWVTFSNGFASVASIDGKLIRAEREPFSQIKFFSSQSNQELCVLTFFDTDDWIIATPGGRFDTNKSLDNIEGLHWVVNDEILKPLPLDVFMRQYYEPELLRRLISGEQFKPLPSIADINRVQPKVSIKEIKSVANSLDLADVIVEVESITEDVSISVTDRTKKKKITSGVYDLRLFRDGQLVDVSTPPDSVKRYNKTSVGLSHDEETKIWREANDLKNLKDVKFDSNGKATFTFYNVRLSRNGEKQTEFSAYAFNADRVKSNTYRKMFDLPDSVSSVRKKGRAYLLTIGVNASDNPRYNLRYAANDARKMQEIVGARLKAEVGSKYSEVVQIPLISDNDVGKESNNARKDIIKGVFSLLAGRRDEVPKDVLEWIEKIARIPAVEPEDTLIIAFSGHGYADQNGIFYMLPADIPKDITSLTTDALKHTISSDELSLWMRDITAEEMLMIVDACHSAAAVQGKDFKPGPMGSRGLGQLAYDKGMRILAATQSDNVALEFSKLQQGLLSYVLIKEGIEDKKADTEPKPYELIATEWLGYAVKQVPQLYQDILVGKRGVLINGKAVIVGQKGSEALNLPGSQIKSGVNLQQPSLFDFRRRNNKNVLFQLQR